jgi:hypothetical protein
MYAAISTVQYWSPHYSLLSQSYTLSQHQERHQGLLVLVGMALPQNRRLICLPHKQLKAI